MASSMWSAMEGGSGTMSSVVADPAAALNSQLASALSTFGDAQFWEESISPSTIRNNLAEADPSNPSHSSNILKCMKWLLASISKGRDVSDFYALVVKLASSQSLEARKLVYMYLVQYADANATTRELSLLSINSFQRDLADSEPWIRALALRVLTSIRLADIVQIQILGIQKCAADSSPYVRKCAATAISKLYKRAHVEYREGLLQTLTELLHTDEATMVLTSALIATHELCPRRLDLLHACFRKVCHLMTDFDEWGQVVAIDLLGRYCRTYFRQPSTGSAEAIDQQRRVKRTVLELDIATGVSGSNTAAANATTVDTSQATLPPRSSPKKVKRRVVRKGFYSDEEDESTEEEVYEDDRGQAVSMSTAFREHVTPNVSTPSAIATVNEDDELAPDHRLLLRSAMPLLKSRNAGVVLAVCSLQYYCNTASVKVRAAIGKALVRIHRDRREIQYVVLNAIRTLATECPSAFTPFLQEFYIKAMDPPFTRLIKLDILTSLALEPAAIEAVLKELRNYARHGDKVFACASIRAVGRVAELARIVYDRHGVKVGDRLKERAQANRIALNCLYGLLTLTEVSDKKIVVGECVIVAQGILQLFQSDAGGSGDIWTVEDSNQVRSRGIKRILLLVVHSLSSRSHKDDPTADNDEEGSETEPTRLEKVALALTPDALAAGLWILGDILSSNVEGLLQSTVNVDKEARAQIRLEIARLVARAFPELTAAEKGQGIHLASKFLVVSRSPQDHSSLNEISVSEHILSMGRLDANPDVRDRARFESSLIRMSVGLRHDTEAMDVAPATMTKTLSVEDAKQVLLSRKPAPSFLPVEDANLNNRNEFRFGSLSSLVGHRARKVYLPLPPWAAEDSPSSLRDPPKKEDKRRSENGSAPQLTGAAPTGGFYEASDDESSSSEESSSASSSSDSSSSMSDSNATGDLIQVHSHSKQQAHNGTPQQKRAPSSSSSSDDDSEASGTSSSSSSNSSRAAVDRPKQSDGNLISLADGVVPGKSAALLSQNGSSVVDDLKGLVLAPIALDQVPTDPDFERDSSVWRVLVRPDHGGGLSVQGRYLRALTKAKEAQRLGLTADKASVVILQIRMHNQKTDIPFRRLRMMLKSSSGSSSSILPRKFVAPPEIELLKPQQMVECVIGFDFAGISDRDESLLAKLDVKFGSGGIPVDLKPNLGDLLLPCQRSVEEFDATVVRLLGFQRMECVISLSADTASLDSLPLRLVKAVALSSVGTLAWGKDHKLRLVGSLPASLDPIFVLVESKSDSSYKVIVCSENALAVNSVLNQIQRSLAQ